MTNNTPARYLTPGAVAELLLVSPITVRKWAERGWLKAEFTAGGHRRFLHREVERFARERGLALHAGADGARLRVLIVDDDEQLRDYLVELLHEVSEAVDTEVAADGFDAGQKVRTFQPEVILLDLRMPGVDGFAVCRRIKADPATRGIRIVAMTDFDTPDARARILEAGAERCLPKPLETERLLDAIGVDYERVEIESVP